MSSFMLQADVSDPWQVWRHGHCGGSVHQVVLLQDREQVQGWEGQGILPEIGRKRKRERERERERLRWVVEKN